MLSLLRSVVIWPCSTRTIDRSESTGVNLRRKLSPIVRSRIFSALVVCVLWPVCALANDQTVSITNYGSCTFNDADLTAPTTTSIKVATTTTFNQGHIATVTYRIGIVVNGVFMENSSYNHTFGAGADQPNDNTFTNLMTGTTYTVKAQIVFDNDSVNLKKTFLDKTIKP
jgi:hypothetical protein